MKVLQHPSKLSFLLYGPGCVRVLHSKHAGSQAHNPRYTNQHGSESKKLSLAVFYLKPAMRKLLKQGKSNGQNNAPIGLKIPLNESHNRSSGDERIIALVQFLARRAAEEDYGSYRDALASPDKEKNGD